MAIHPHRPSSRVAPETWLLPGVEEPRRWLVLASLLATIPAFYLEMLTGERSTTAILTYVMAALVLGFDQWRRRSGELSLPRRWLVGGLVCGLVMAAALPASSASLAALSLRLVTAMLTLLHMMWLLRHLLARDSLPVLLGTAVLVLVLCGAGFWWLEPRTPTLQDGLWLAFTTAATVGYGDIVPSTPASKIFAVFVVLLGFGILSLVTASIAAVWVESSERQMEKDILTSLHAELGQLRAELRATHTELLSLKAQLHGNHNGHGSHANPTSPAQPAAEQPAGTQPAGYSTAASASSPSKINVSTS